MKFHRTYHPESWSAQARRMCDQQIEYVNSGWTTIDRVIHFFSTSYRNDLITRRAAKRFGRMVRAGKVHEDLETFRTHWFDEDLIRDYEYNGTPLPKYLR